MLLQLAQSASNSGAGGKVCALRYLQVNHVSCREYNAAFNLAVLLQRGIFFHCELKDGVVVFVQALLGRYSQPVRQILGLCHGYRRGKFFQHQQLRIVFVDNRQRVAVFAGHVRGLNVFGAAAQHRHDGNAQSKDRESFSHLLFHFKFKIFRNGILVHTAVPFCVVHHGVGGGGVPGQLRVKVV